MKKLIFILSLFGTVIFVSCYHPTPKQAFEDMRILEGEWTTYEGSQFNESWKVFNDSLIKGVGFSLVGADTAFSEQLVLKRNGDSVYYGAWVGNNKGYVYFKLSEANRKQWIFINSNHDYPNIIDYKLENDTLLEATTSNIRGNKKIVFKMKRVSR